MVHVDSYTSRGKGTTSVVNRKAMRVRGDRTRYRLKHVHDVYTYLVIRHTRNSRRHFMHKKSTRKTKNNELCIDSEFRVQFRVPSSENLFAGESQILPGQQERVPPRGVIRGRLVKIAKNWALGRGGWDFRL